eukprot:1182530-Prorocentrum_minimum.AAC.1
MTRISRGLPSPRLTAPRPTSSAASCRPPRPILASRHAGRHPGRHPGHATWDKPRRPTRPLPGPRAAGRPGISSALAPGDPAAGLRSGVAGPRPKPGEPRRGTPGNPARGPGNSGPRGVRAPGVSAPAEVCRRNSEEFVKKKTRKRSRTAGRAGGWKGDGAAPLRERAHAGREPKRPLPIAQWIADLDLAPSRNLSPPPPLSIGRSAEPRARIGRSARRPALATPPPTCRPAVGPRSPACTSRRGPDPLRPTPGGQAGPVARRGRNVTTQKGGPVRPRAHLSVRWETRRAYGQGVRPGEGVTTRGVLSEGCYLRGAVREPGGEISVGL